MKASYFIVKILMVCFGFVASVAAVGEPVKFSYGGINYEIIGDNEVRTAVGIGRNLIGGEKIPNSYWEYIPGNFVSGILEIPETVVYEGKRYSVVEIGDNSFGCNPIYYLSLPRSVKKVGEWSFYETDLEGMIDLRYVEEFGKHSFDCPKLDKVVLSDNLKNVSLYEIFFKSSDEHFLFVPKESLQGKDNYIGLPEDFICEESYLSDADEKLNGSLENVYPPLNTDSGVFYEDLIGYKITGGTTCKTRPGTYSFRSEDYLMNIALTFNPGNGVIVGNFEVKDAVVKDGKTYKVTEIGKISFANFPKSFNIPESVVRIGSYSFYNANCDLMKMPAGLRSIGVSAFEKSSLSGDLDLQNIVKAGDFAFSFTNISSATLPLNFGRKEISTGKGLFYGCEQLETVLIPDEAEILPAGTFYNCKAIGSVTIPESVSYIGDIAFRNCIGLTSVSLPEKLSYIGNQAFAGCAGLNEITIPAFVGGFGNFVWADCDAVEKIYYKGYDLVEASADIFPDSVYETATLYLTTEAMAEVSEVSPWNRFVNVVDTGTSGVDEVEAGVESENDAVYNLQGMKVSDRLENLPKGIYIFKGKKIAVK